MDHGKTTVYISVLLQSLQKKSAVLDELIVLSEEQASVLSQESVEKESLDSIIDKKNKLLNDMDEIDQGFSNIYSRTRDQLKENANEYQAEVKQLQIMITQLTEKGVKLEALERRNKLKMEMWLHREKGKIKQYKSSKKSSNNYYNVMNKLNVSETYFFDQKK